MGISLRVMSNPHYQRNPVTGYFRLGQYQQVPNLKTLISVEGCGKTGLDEWLGELNFGRFFPRQAANLRLEIRLEIC